MIETPFFWAQDVVPSVWCKSCWTDGRQVVKYANPQGFTMCTHCDVPQPEALVPSLA